METLINDLMSILEISNIQYMYVIIGLLFGILFLCLRGKR